jgi:hypothetical protein
VRRIGVPLTWPGKLLHASAAPMLEVNDTLTSKGCEAMVVLRHCRI